ncbi:MAG: apolipoprotein N-acyltransferase [Blastocatellia bacterium]|nr:MAG: apolipoprotein N-acyltransferase [Blastocatellia bacterium]
MGLTSGLLYFTGTLYWITNVMVLYGGLATWVAILVNALLIAYLALFPALFALIMRRLLRRSGAQALLVAPCVWVATELGRTYVPPGGFPWVLLGYSQVTTLPIAQLASLVGVYGVSALVASVSAVAAFCVAPTPPRRRMVAVVTMALVIVALATWGSRRVVRSDWSRAGEPLQVGIIQGNVDQAEKWNGARSTAIFKDYLRMTRQAIGNGAEIVLWPESSTPFMFEEDHPAAEQVRTLARQARVPILLGSDQTERGPATRYYNSAFLVGADGSTAGVYRKIHLVPFGEYVPMRRVLFFAAPLVEAVSDFSPGDQDALLPVGSHRISTAICYEVVYPNLIRQFVRSGSELLTTITNDAWFGRTSAPYQHFAQASMRAIEEGRYLVRSANTGISGIVDPYGRVLAQTDIFLPAVLVGSVRLLKETTLYMWIGDGLAYASVGVTIVLLVFARRRGLIGSSFTITHPRRNRQPGGTA